MIALAGAQVKASSAQRRRLKQLHWDKIRAPSEGTVWSHGRAAPLALDFSQLESMFQVGLVFCYLGKR